MTPVGPRLPSSNAEKRKRDSDKEDGNTSSSDSDIGPAPPSQIADPVVKKARVIGPSLPPSSNTNELSASKPNRSSDSEESDDDDFGPSLPPTGAEMVQNSHVAAEGPTPPVESIGSSKRDDWMLVPPTSGDWSARADPTKIKSRKFNSGKGPKTPSASGVSASDAWHETPQEKQARLQREMMGIKDTSTKSATQSAPANTIDAGTAKRLKEYNKSRGPTLYEAHQGAETVEKDDDPSARAFDREKDIGGGLQINATQRRDLVKKAADFGSRFSSARYL